MEEPSATGYSDGKFAMICCCVLAQEGASECPCPGPTTILSRFKGKWTQQGKKVCWFDDVPDQEQ